MIRRAWVNGVLHEDGEAASVAVADRGLAYGDGLFETVRIEAGRPVLGALHLQRMAASAHAIGIAFDLSAVETHFPAFIRDAGDAVAKILLTRGAGGRGYQPDPGMSPTLVFLLYPPVSWPDALAEAGVVAAICRQPLGVSPMLAGHKHLNRLEQVLLRQELASVPGAHEALVTDVDGHVTEGVFSNLFFVREGVLHTPLLDRAGVRGVMRQFLMEAAPPLGIPLREGRYDARDVLAADEVFFCNSLYGIWPVRQMADQVRQPGPVTRRLQQCWDEMLRAS